MAPRRLTVLALLIACAIGDVEAALTRTCDAAAASPDASALLVADGEDQDSRSPASGDERSCQCVHPHANARPRADRLIAAALPASALPRVAAERVPISADRSLPLRPPRA